MDTERVKKALILLRNERDEWKAKYEATQQREHDLTQELHDARRQVNLLKQQLAQQQQQTQQQSSLATQADAGSVAVRPSAVLDSLLEEVMPTGAAATSETGSDLDSLIADMSSAINTNGKLQEGATGTGTVVGAGAESGGARPSNGFFSVNNNDSDDEEEGICIAPGRSQTGKVQTHVQTARDVMGSAYEEEKRGLYDYEGAKSTLAPTLIPKEGEVVTYVYVGPEQLDADIAYLKKLLAAKVISQATFQAQRDHMLVQQRGGRKYGAVFTSKPGFAGRTYDAEYDKKRFAFRPLKK